jgi:class 3 adenylate cyclase
VRASDQDRERVVGVLRDHFSAGRLSDDELGARTKDAYQARTVEQLDALTHDLPSANRPLPAPSARRRSDRELTAAGRGLATSIRIHATIYVLVNVMLVAIWAITGAGYFWPIWPILGWGVGVGAHAAPLIAGVGTRPRRSLPPASAAQAPAGPAAVTQAPAVASIERVATSVEAERPDLHAAAAPDGTVTILFSDIEGSTEINERLGDTRWMELLRAHHRVIRGQVQAYGGFEVKVMGDGFMVAFPGARRAVQCARAIQQAIASEFDGGAEPQIRVRIGLHTGEVLREQDDFYGKNVVLAARIAQQAAGGEILASALVKELVQSGGDIGFEDEREVSLKGLTGTYRVYRVT